MVDYDLIDFMLKAFVVANLVVFFYWGRMVLFFIINSEDHEEFILRFAHFLGLVVVFFLWLYLLLNHGRSFLEWYGS